jgi:hypothetical protein
MLTTIKKLIDKLFAQKNAVEEFILSKHPQTAADVEHWARVYAQKNGGWSV